MAQNDLRYLATVLAQLDGVTASPAINSIIAGDYINTRRFIFAPECTNSDAAAPDVGLNTDTLVRVARRAGDNTRFAVTGEGLVIEYGSTKYRLNVMVPTSYDAEPHVAGTGVIRVNAADMHAALGDVRAADSHAVVIAITKQGAVLRGEGGSSIDCWIPMPNAESEGTGYSRLSLDLLFPCVPKTKHDLEITLSPKGPTKMRFGDKMTYYQAAMA